MIRPLSFVGATLLLGLLGCGGGGGGHAESVESVRIAANAATVKPGGTTTFTAFLEGGRKTVTWTVDGTDAGTITSSGVYTAPATEGTYTVRASAGGKEGTATVVVSNGTATGVTIAFTSPTTVPIAVPLSKLTFAARVTGSANTTLTYSASGGTIAADGTYTAPATPGTYTVTATSGADATKTATASVQVAASVNVRVKWQGKDDVVMSLRPDKAPNTVANYVTLVNRGFYDGIVAHRYEAGFVIQWGDPLTKTLPLTDSSIGTGGPGYTIPFEENDLSNVRYSLAQARSSDKDSGGSQVYVNLADNTSLDHTATNQGYVVFGTVTSGQATIDALRRGDTIVSARTELP